MKGEMSLNWDKKKSVTLSQACLIAFSIMLAALDVAAYWFSRWFFGMRGVSSGIWLYLMITIYAVSVPAWLCLCTLWRLLYNIKKGRVFIPDNVRYLRVVSWCCTAAAALCLASAAYYLPFIFVAIAAAFMSLIVRIVKNVLDVMMAKRKISSGELAERVGITPANLSILKTGKAKAIRFSTLMALCHELDCQPGDILEFKEN